MFVQQALYLLSYALSPYTDIFQTKNNLGKCTNIPKLLESIKSDDQCMGL